ncbi:hypothetical protein AXG93_4368s1840 [Marchantia polymorpha subsp. ruderalis]|uniref:Uncharacterized protein n=1 Tax=Marchantia polymorpha subsp. ruderalis TaxID=1480154 RepID=A0A176VY39_MARPO|nr:hypothetical protein AXG93_4368s1840 [Marchantia polymorpha subsp. ruderalis]
MLRSANFTWNEVVGGRGVAVVRTAGEGSKKERRKEAKKDEEEVWACSLLPAASGQLPQPMEFAPPPGDCE